MVFCDNPETEVEVPEPEYKVLVAKVGDVLIYKSKDIVPLDTVLVQLNVGDIVKPVAPFAGFGLLGMVGGERVAVVNDHTELQPLFVPFA